MAGARLAAPGDLVRAWTRGVVPLLQRAALHSDRGPLRPVWRLMYAVAARAFAILVRRGETDSAAYVRGTLSSREMLPGLTDIDVVVVVRPDAREAGAARERVRRRCARVSRRLPVLGGLLFDWPTVYEEPDLRGTAVGSTLIHGLDRPGADASTVYWGPGADPDKLRCLERPELYGRMRSWQRLGGPDLRPAESGECAGSRRVTAWLELQNWWRWAFSACLEPGKPATAYLCVKLIAEPVRIWLWLTRGRRVGSRAEALELGLTELPDEAEAFSRALELHRTLRRLPEPPLGDLLPAFVRLSARVAREIEDQVSPAGATEVLLTLPREGELALPHGGAKTAEWASLCPAAPTLMPLADWRALVASIEPDETFALLDGDPGDPRVLAAAAAVLDRGPYPTLRAAGLLVRPAPMGGRSRLRSVQCRVTDPVSFALVEGVTTARFPNVPGWSIADTAQRAVAEHAAWLADDGGDPSGWRGSVLGRLITSARAALLWESVQDGRPVVPLTVDATLGSLGDRDRAAAGVAEVARQAYHDFAVHWRTPEEELVTALRDAVLDLPAYAAPERIRCPA